MDEPDLERLVASWVRLQHAERGSEAHAQDFWSFETLWDYCADHPDWAWRVIVDMHGGHADEKTLANLAAGPVEDLLVKHGDLALPWIEQYCIGHPGFVTVLQMVWRNAMTDEVWDGLNRLIKKYA
jgi:hypothetical protein